MSTFSNTDISGLFLGMPAKLVSELTGRPWKTIEDCRGGRSNWRADDIMRAAARSAEVRARAIALLNSLEHG